MHFLYAGTFSVNPCFMWFSVHLCLCNVFVRVLCIQISLFNITKHYIYRIWNEFSFHTVFMKRFVCFRCPSLWWWYIKHTTSFINTVWNEIPFQILFIAWSFRKLLIFHEKMWISRKCRAIVALKRRNLRDVITLFLYDVPGKEARNWCKKCYVTCVSFENLWNHGFMKGRIMWQIGLFTCIIISMFCDVLLIICIVSFTRLQIKWDKWK